MSFEFLLEPINTIPWLLGSAAIAWNAFKYNKMRNDIVDTAEDLEVALNRCTTWIRPLNEAFDYKRLNNCYQYMVIELPYVRGVFEAYAPRCFQERVHPDILTGHTVVSSISNKQEWFEVYQYLNAVQWVSPYRAIPVARPIDDFRHCCPNKLFADFHECIGFNYVEVDPDEHLFVNSFWPKPQTHKYTFRVKQESKNPSEFRVFIEDNGEADVIGINVKKIRRIIEFPTKRTGGYHFRKARLFPNKMAQYGVDQLIRTYKGDYLVRLSDINAFNCDMEGMRVVLPRGDVNGREFDTMGGRLLSGAPNVDGSYKVAIKEPYRKYIKGKPDVIWVFPQDLYVWLDKGSFKDLTINDTTSDRLLIGTITGSNGAEIRCGVDGDVYMYRPMKPLQEKYPNIPQFIKSLESRFKIHVLYMDEMIYLNLNKMFSYIGIPVYYMADDEAKLLGPVEIVDVSGKERHTIKLANGVKVDESCTYIALDPVKYNAFGGVINEYIMNLRIIGKIAGDDRYVITNTNAGIGNLPIFYTLNKTQYNMLANKGGRCFIDDDGRIRFWLNDSVASASTGGSNSAFLGLVNKVHDEILQPQQVQQVQQDDRNVYNSSMDDDIVIEARRRFAKRVGLPPDTYTKSPIEFKKEMIQREGQVVFHRSTGAELKVIHNNEGDVMYVNTVNGIRIGRLPDCCLALNPHAKELQAEYILPSIMNDDTFYLFYTGTGNTMSYTIYADCVVFITENGNYSFPKLPNCYPDIGYNMDFSNADIVCISVPQNLLPYVRKSFLNYAMRAYFNPVLYKAKTEIDESVIMHCIRSSMDWNTKYRCDLLHPGVMLNGKALSIIQCARANAGSPTITCVSTMDFINGRENELESKCYMQTFGQLIHYPYDVAKFSSIDASRFFCNKEVVFGYNPIGDGGVVADGLG